MYVRLRAVSACLYVCACICSWFPYFIIITYPVPSTDAPLDRRICHGHIHDEHSPLNKKGNMQQTRDKAKGILYEFIMELFLDHYQIMKTIPAIEKIELFFALISISVARRVPTNQSFEFARQYTTAKMQSL